MGRFIQTISPDWLLRIPLAVVFLQQGFAKVPIDFVVADAFGVSSLVWMFVVLGEIGAGLGLLFAGAIRNFFEDYSDMLTRFSGIVICCIMTGVIWISQPANVWDVVLYDNFHALLWAGGLFFALKGNVK